MIILIITAIQMIWPVLFSTKAMIVALGITAAAGIVYGFYLAWKTSWIHTIVELRQESCWLITIFAFT